MAFIEIIGIVIYVINRADRYYSFGPTQVCLWIFVGLIPFMILYALAEIVNLLTYIKDNIEKENLSK